jgi:hypothetical protein
MADFHRLSARQVKRHGLWTQLGSPRLTPTSSALRNLWTVAAMGIHRVVG